MSLSRREFLPSLALLGVPKEKSANATDAWDAPMHMGMLIRALNQTIRFEMSDAQHAVWTMLKVSSGLKDDSGFAAGMCNVLPITVNPGVPRDEIWLVAWDGTVMSKIKNLALPTGFEMEKP